MSKEQPTNEETEFRRAELELFMHRYGLEGIHHVLGRVLTTIKNMIKQGEVPASEEGVQKAMSLITSAHPEVEQYLEKFKTAAHREMLHEMKQTARPN
jgi:DNA replication protein DnaD